MHRSQYGAFLTVPSPHQVEQIGRGLGVDGVERFVEHDDAGVLQQQPCKQHALHLAARQRPNGAILEARKPNRRDRVFDRIARLASDAAEQAGAMP